MVTELSSINVLLIEADASEHAIIRHLLAEAAHSDFNLECRTDYDAGLKALLNGNYDVCLADYHLAARECDRLALIRKAEVKGVAVPMIFLIDPNRFQAGLSAVEGGASDCLVKGEFSCAQLERSLRYAIERNKRDKAALMSSQAVYRSIARNFPNGAVYVFDRDLRFLVADGAALEMIGWSADSIEGKCVEEFDEAKKILETRFRRVLAGESLRFETIYRDRVMLSDYAPIKDENGKVIMGMVVSTDITERKQMEESLRRSEERARRRTEEVEKIMNLVPAAIWVADDPECRNITGNLTANAFYESEEGENVSAGPAPGAQNLVRRFFSNGRELMPEELPMQEAAAKGIEIRNSELEVLRPSGRLFTMMGNASPLLDAEGKVRGAVGVFIDITERRQAETALRKAHDELEMRVKERTEELEKTNSELHDFTFIISHDLQEPLRKIQVFGSLLRSVFGKALDEVGRGYLSRMESSAARMQNLILDLLRYNRITDKEKTFTKIELKEIVGQTIVDLSSLAELVGGTIEIGDLPAIEANPILIGQLFQNLIANALKYHGEEPPLVRIYCTNAFRETCEIVVADNGIGFEPAHADIIFKPFKRLHGREAYEGTGMGLAICRKIAERHGGNITTESALGKGSTFVIRLPVKQKS